MNNYDYLRRGRGRGRGGRGSIAIVKMCSTVYTWKFDRRLYTLALQLVYNIIIMLYKSCMDSNHNTVEPLLADTPNSGHLPYNGQCAMYQLRFPYIPYFKTLRIADTPNSGHLRIADSFSGTTASANTSL